MLNTTRITNAEQAGNYYREVDDYYREGDLAPSRWHGKAAGFLGFDGEVNSIDFVRTLSGRLPDGTVLPGAEGGKRRLGYDLTFQADKSVSVLALAGEHEIAAVVIRAHDRAVVAALDLIERRIGSRIKGGGEVRFEQTGNFAAAVYRHATSRAQQPHLHSHAVVMNMTRDTGGQWRAIESDVLAEYGKDASQLYQLTLAQELKHAGIRTERKVIRGLTVTRATSVSDDLCDQLSTRSKEVEKALAELGLTRATSTRKQREAAALATRRAKEPMDHRQLRAQWRAEVEVAGRLEELKGVRSVSRDTDETRSGAATAAVISAAAHLAEREARFTRRELTRAAQGNAIGSGVGCSDIEDAIERLRNAGKLIDRTVERWDRSTHGIERVDALTTPEAIHDEHQMIAVMRAGIGRVKAMVRSDSDALRRIARASRQSEYPWTQSQRTAAHGILTSRDAVVAIQGYAGTAKTTTVLKKIAREGEAAGLEVVGLAPSASATAQLAEGAELAEGTTQTVAAYLARRESSRRRPARLILVDEASLLSSTDMSRLLERARQAGDRVVLVGDVRQLGSVGRGEAFRQLQEAGMSTYRLDQIVRQRTAVAREAVAGVLARDAGRALAALSLQPGGGIIEVEKPSRGDHAKARRKAIARDYLSLTPAQRDRTILIDPTRAGRRELNALIRRALKREGAIGACEVRVEGLEDKGLSGVQVRDVAHYSPGDRVIFARDRKREGIKAGEVYRVVKTDHARLELHLESLSGSSCHLVRPEQVGHGKMSVFRIQDLLLAKGDRVAWVRNTPESGLKNGDRGMVLMVSGQIARIRFGRGKRAHTVDVDLSKPQPLRHDYATTVHASQGRTADRVLAHVEVAHTGLIDNRSLYVAVSRARDSVQLYTDDAGGLRTAIEERSGERDTALENEHERDRRFAEELQSESQSDHDGRVRDELILERVREF